MKDQKLKIYLIWSLLIIGACFVIMHNLIPEREMKGQIIEEEGIYRIGRVSVDTEKGEIQFKGRIFKDNEWVQHLLYLEGYKWLKEESAIISNAELSDLQKAIALLDWRLWDELWYRKTSNQKLLLSVKWDEEEVAAQKLVLTEDELEIGDLIFLGSPYFDHIALEAPPGVDCRLCPVFPLEEKALRETFIRASGQSGYELNSEKMPSQETEVTMIMRFSR
ncbi:MAG: hypothetical protein KKA80_00770 [Candidatus Omnitrophica bacterium]|nr:hypothetical protein [Candidatus Omnitrophota bacterium]